MQDTFNFNIWPNLKIILVNYNIIFIIFILLVFIILVIALFFLIKFFILISFKNKAIYENDLFIKQIKEYYKNNLQQKKGKTFIKDFINFLEYMKYKGHYKNINDILFNIGFLNENNIETIKNIVYYDDNEENIDEIVNLLKERLDKL